MTIAEVLCLRRYCGEYTDTESGLIYLRNRYYDPSIGRFITEDPIRDGSNWYIYCDNNPVMYVDPSGNMPGDEFGSMDEAVKDFSYTYNPWSIKVDAEYATRIYSYSIEVLEKKMGKSVIYNKTFYSYTDPFTSWMPKRVEFGDSYSYISDNKKYIIEKAAKRGTVNIKNIRFEAIAHTHGSLKPEGMNSKYYVDTYIPFANESELKRKMRESEMFSQEDKTVAQQYGGKIYLVSPTGVIKEYRVDKFIKERILDRNAPYDDAFRIRGL